MTQSSGSSSPGSKASRTPGKPLVPPLDLSAAHYFESSEALSALHESRTSYTRYGRESTSNQRDLEGVLEEYFPNFRALVFSSGMAANETLMQWAWKEFSALVITSEVYRKTEAVIDHLSSLASRDITRIDARADIPKFVPNDGFFFLEAPSNPHLRLVDLKAARDSLPGAFFAADLTLAGLGNVLPDQLDRLDAVVLSLTKYASGHNDVMGGALLVREERYRQFWDDRARSGSVLAPFDCYLLQRSLRTYSLRWTAQLAHTSAVFQFLEGQLVEGNLGKLFYPGNGSNSDQLDLAQSFMHGFGSVLSMVPRISREEIANRLNRLQVVKLAPSFGAVDSLIEVASLMSQPSATLDALAAQGLEPNLVRLSVGLEDVDMIVDDLQRILAT